MTHNPDGLSMSDRVEQLAQQASAKIDADHSQMSDYTPQTVRQELNATDWYLSTALREAAARIDALESRLAKLDGGAA